MNSLRIDTLENAGDGHRVIVTLDGTPSGTLSFMAGRVPETAQAINAPHTLSGSTYYLTLPHRGLWYIWAKDNNGYSEPEAILMGVSGKVLLTEIGRWLQDTLIANKKGLNAYARTVNPRVSVNQIVYGDAANVTGWPTLLITDPRFNSNYAFMPYGLQNNYAFTITVPVVHETEESQMDIATALAEGAAFILRQPLYQRFFLEDGIEVCFGFVSEVEISGMKIGDRMVNTAQITWTGNTVNQDTGQ